jgi:hypothetical protein
VCECGCGWEGEDEVTQWLIEEAAFTGLEIQEAKVNREAVEEQLRETRLMAAANRAIGR